MSFERLDVIDEGGRGFFSAVGGLLDLFIRADGLCGDKTFGVNCWVKVVFLSFGRLGLVFSNFRSFFC